VRADNFEFDPIRLTSTRVGSNRYELAREGEDLGVVWLREGEWFSRPVGRDSQVRHPTFLAAALRLARSPVHFDHDMPQNYGKVHMIRIGGMGAWYTVIFDGESRYIYQDHTLKRTKLNPRLRADVQAVLARAEAFAKENL